MSAAVVEGFPRPAASASFAAIAAVVLLLAPMLAVPARAQAPAGSGGPTWEVAGGAVFVGGYDLGTSVAELTPNTDATGPFALFTTKNEVRPAVGVQARIGFVVSRAWTFEAGFRFSRPVYQVRVSGDVENAADITIEENLSQYLFDGSALWHFGSGRAVPFVFGGAGYIRELHDADALVEDGLEYHAGAGVKWWLAQTGRGFGLRGDVGISIRDGAFDFEESRRLVPIASGSLIYRF